MQWPVGHDQRADAITQPKRLKQENRTSSFYIYLKFLKFESYNLQSKNLVHKGVDFHTQNALKLTYEDF